MDQTIGGAAYEVLEAHRVRFESYRDAAWAGEGREAIHQMRVNARRLRACLRAFRPILTESLLELETELRWIATSLGEVRDVDVQIERMPEMAGLLRELRIARLDQLRRDLDSPRYTNLSEALARRIAVGAHDDPFLAAAPVIAVAPDIVWRAYRAVERAAARIGESSEAAEIHVLRKKAKRLRYTADCFAGQYGKAGKRFIDSLKELQDLLGAHQDAIVAQAFCAELRGRGFDFELEGHKRQARDTAETLRAALPDAMGHLAARWQPFKRAMKRKRRQLWKKVKA